MAGAARALGPRARYQRIVEYIWLAAEFGEGLRALVDMAYKLQSMRRLGLDVEEFCRDVSKAYAEAHDIYRDEVISALEKLRYDEEADAFYLEGEGWEAYAVLGEVRLRLPPRAEGRGGHGGARRDGRAQGHALLGDRAERSEQRAGGSLG